MHIRSLIVAGGVALASLTELPAAHACCNVIPSASTSFRGSLGGADRPFAAPNEFLQLSVDTALCDVASAGFAPTAAEHVVTVVFTPPANGPRRVVVLAAGDCAANPLRKKLDTCAATAGVASVTCVTAAADDLTFTGTPPRLSFRFPDTDAVLAPAGDAHTLTGPATIAVTRATDPLPCALATTRCAAATAVPGLVACLDDLFTADGTCRNDEGAISRTFPHFTALPPANDYGTLCTDPSGLCAGSAPEVQFTLDAGGNVLLPVDWRHVLVRDDGAPVPRLLHGSTSIEAFAGVHPIRLPGPAFLASYTPEGILLPPIFVPQQDPTSTNELTLFGSSDAPYSILRIARRGPELKACDAGTNAGRPCVDAGDCPGGACGQATCVGGGQAGQLCTADTDCPGGECGPSAFDLSGLIAGGGPALLPRVATGQGVCESGTDVGQTCTPGSCTGGARCVNFRSRAEDAVPLAGLAGTPELFALTASERLTGADLNGDGDQLDLALTLRDRLTGGIEGSCSVGSQSCLTAADCGAGTCDPIGRAVTSISEPPFSFPTVEAEGNVVAFLEPEPGQGNTDKNGDGDVADTILRVFRTGGAGSPEVTAGQNLAADAAPLVNGRSVAISGGTVFFRRPERDQARHVTERVSVLTGGFEANGASFLSTRGSPISSDGRFVGFVSSAANLGVVGVLQTFVRDRLAGTTEMVSVDDLGAPLFADASTRNGFAGFGLSADDRFVTFDEALHPGVLQNEAVVRDRTLGTTQVVSTTSGGSLGDHDSASYSWNGSPSISADGRYVAFGSLSTNFAPGTTVDCSAVGAPNCQQIYVKDTATGAIELASVTSGGGQAANNLSEGSIISADGRYVLFFSLATNLAVGDANVCDYFTGLTDPGTCPDAFLHDRLTGTTELVSRGMDGFPANGLSAPIDITPDGRYVLFSSNAPNIVPGDTVNTCDENFDGVFDENCADLFVLDRQTGTIEMESVNSDGEPGNADSGEGSLSVDGRYVSFASFATNLVPGATPGTFNCYVRDRLTGITQIASQRAAGGPAQSPFMANCRLSADGLVTVFDNYDDQVTPPDTNGNGDVFTRSLDPTDLAADLTGDGTFDDTVLSTVDVGTGIVTGVCPAGAVAVAAGTAAFLRPENAGPTPSLPACTGSGDLNGDGDTGDQVVQLLPAGGALQNLSRAATAVALSARCTGGSHDGEVCDDATLDCAGSPCTPTVVAALVSEAGQGAGPLNGDGDTNDTVVEIHRVSDSPDTWTNVGVAADTVAVAGGLVGFLVPEAAQGAGPLNGDGDTADRVLDLYDSDGAGLLPTGYAAEDFVLGTPHHVSCAGETPTLRQFVAFRVNEVAQGAGPLNGDGDTGDDVLFVYDVTAHTVIPTGQAVVPCRLQACDPREPYRVFSHSVKFLTKEADQGPVGTDLNHDGDTADTVIQVFDVCSGVTTTIGTLADASDTAGAATNVDPLRDQPAGGQVFVGAGGRCVNGTTVLLQPGSCAKTADCPPGATCVVNRRCYQGTQVLTTPASCVVDTDCPAGATCQAEQVGVASSDADEDGVPDAIDNCPTVPNATQQDTDHDGVGDACDPATCGNGVIEPGEQCDGGAGCRPDCTAVCGTTLADPKDSVKVVTKNGKGALTVKVTLPLASYAGEPVTVRLDDDDTTPIAQRALATLAPKGHAGTTFQFKAKGPGLQGVMLRNLGGASFQLQVKAKQWFTAATADEGAAQTRLTLTIGSRCFTRAATKKID
jgi:hypothetical protein